MNRIVASHLKGFTTDNGIELDSESTQFEKFVNFIILSSKIASGFELDEVTTDENDDGTDGIALIINEDHIVSEGDADLVFSHDRRNNDVEIVFIQAKRTEGYDLGEFLKFKESILRFLTQEPYHINCELQQDARKAFDVVIRNVPKVRNGKPNILANYVTTGVYNNPEAFETAKNDMIRQLRELGLFQDIEVRFMGREELVRAWVASYSGINASIPMHSSASLPHISGIEESYLVVVKAKDYVDNLLSSDDGTIRGQLFEENVRHYLGAENPVNAQIIDTLNKSDAKTRFPVLNNGVTIVSPDVKVQGTTLHLTNFQIVNGCQTSHVLFEHKEKLTDEIMVALKIVETTDEDVFSELVRATNSQTKIDENQFLSLSPITKNIEAYFNTFEGQDGRLYFERRDKQYVGKGIPAIRIVSLHNAAKCVCAMFLRRPDLAFKYPKRMYEDFGDKIFKHGNKESIFYSSSLALYRLHLLTSNNVIPQNMRRFKWHILALVAAIIAGKDIPPLDSKKVDSYCQPIIDSFSRHSEEATNIFSNAANLINALGEVSNDRLKRQAVLDELLGKV